MSDASPPAPAHVPTSAATEPPAVRRHLPLLWVLAACLVAMVLFARQHPPVKFRGDEEPYARIAHESYGPGASSLRWLPGGFGFHYWPPLSFCTYGAFATPELDAHFDGRSPLGEEELNGAIAAFLRPIVWLNGLWLLVATVSAYGLATTLGARPRFAALGAALLALNPRVLFYVQALWPELLHFALFLPALWLLARHLRRAPAHAAPAHVEWVPLLGTSCLLAYAALTKGISAIYTNLLLLLFLWWHRAHLRSRATLLTLVALFVPFHACLGVQRASNLASDGAFAISSNTWVNIEKGLIPASVAVEAGYRNTSERYAQAAEDQMGRERASRQRVGEYLASQPTGAVLGHLLRQYRNLPGNSFLQRGIYTERWSDPAALLNFETLAALLSWFTTVLGVLGAAALWRTSRGATALAVFLAYYMGALYIVGWNERFLVQALPVLAVFAALALQRLFTGSAGTSTDAPPAAT